MKGTIITAAVLIAALACLQGAPPQTYKNNGSSTNTVVIKPQAMPTSLTSVTANDAWILGMTVINNSGAAITATVQCNESPNTPFLGTASIPANATYTIPTTYMHWCPGGFSVQAGGSGLYYYAIWKE